jgi:hypothetical protein
MIDPLKIKESDLPLVVLSDDRRSFLGWAIKAHTQGNYNHIMEMHKEGFFASQNFSGFKEIPVEKYMKNNISLKFWQYKDLSPEKKKEWIDEVNKELKEPGWKKGYDWLGIVGQFLSKIHPKFRWLNIPWAEYCSERVNPRIRNIWNIFLPYKANPSEANEKFKNRPNKMQVFGKWEAD